jgi:16S rRNA (adenine1518-N6/adenine1519-N6)-dimethyltransferase
MNLSQIKRTLDAESIQPTKSLGQHFLHDTNQLRRIVAAAELEPTDKVLEIGPGLGALTHLILQRTPQILAVEKDQRLCELLREHWADTPGLELLHADALAYLRQRRADWSDWKLVSNLPFSAASSILIELARTPTGPERMVITVQLEVAQKLAAVPRQDGYSVLTLLLQLCYPPASMFKIPAACFYPVPEVDCACVTMLRRSAPLLEAGQFPAFEQIVRRGFSQRRKMMMKLLKADWPVLELERAFAEAEIAAEARGETVSLEQYVELTKRLCP